jgi:hypothetical protein
MLSFSIFVLLWNIILFYGRTCRTFCVNKPLFSLSFRPGKVPGTVFGVECGKISVLKIRPGGKYTVCEQHTKKNKFLCYLTPGGPFSSKQDSFHTSPTQSPITAIFCNNVLVVIVPQGITFLV